MQLHKMRCPSHGTNVTGAWYRMEPIIRLQSRRVPVPIQRCSRPPLPLTSPDQLTCRAARTKWKLLSFCIDAGLQQKFHDFLSEGSLETSCISLIPSRENALSQIRLPPDSATFESTPPFPRTRLLGSEAWLPREPLSPAQT